MRIRPAGALFLGAVGVTVLLACAPSTVDVGQLVAHLDDFEREIEERPPSEVRHLLAQQARQFKGRVLRVRSAVVASTYVRENSSRIYFGTNYEPGDHLYLSEIDPALHETLTNHRRWVSVAWTGPTRQLSFELPVDDGLFQRLERGSDLSFSCRIAALIRGRSVYCVPIEIELADSR